MEFLKFRVWSETQKIMVNVQWSASFDADGTVNVALFHKMTQYIGIKDRNNIEIYVGDIVNCNRYENEENYLVIIEDIRNLPKELYGSNLNYREVIGNIYANPELLNDNKLLKTFE